MHTPTGRSKKEKTDEKSRKTCSTQPPAYALISKLLEVNQQIIMKQSLNNIPSTRTMPVPQQTTHRCCLWAIMSELESKWPNQPYASLIYWPQYKLYYSNYRKEHKQVNPWSRDSSWSGKQKKEKENCSLLWVIIHVENMSQCSIGRQKKTNYICLKQI